MARAGGFKACTMVRQERLCLQTSIVQRIDRTPGWSPSINSTPAASSARRIAARLLIEGTRRPFSKSRMVLSLRFDRAANSQRRRPASSREMIQRPGCRIRLSPRRSWLRNFHEGGRGNPCPSRSYRTGDHGDASAYNSGVGCESAPRRVCVVRVLGTAHRSD
jgi:hypothetical protein